MRPAVALVLLAACADLTKLPADTCGNGVLEPGEDCDGPSNISDVGGVCQACRYVCAQTPDCPTAWACGGDGVCRHGTGVLEPLGTIDEDASQLALGDVDADGRADVIGVGGGRAWWYHNGPDGFVLGGEREAPLASAAPAQLGSFDGDAWLDGAFEPFARQLELVRGGPGGPAAVALPWSTFAPELETNLHVLGVHTAASLPSGVLLAMTYDVNGHELAFETLDHGVRGPALDVPIASPPNASWATAADLDGDGIDEIAVSVSGDPTVWILEAGSPPVVTATVTLSGPVDGAAIVADLDGDGRRDLLVPTIAGADDQLDVVLQPSAGTFVAGPPDPRFTPPLLAVADLDGDGALDEVSPTGIALARGGAYLTVANAGGGGWGEARVLDVNRDGHLDVVATEADEVDTLLGGDGLLYSVWQRPAVAPHGLTVGDFDGDRFPDVAYTATGGATIAYGGPQGAPGDPRVLAIEGELAATTLADADAFPLDDVSELAVLQPNGIVAVFGGSSARQPFAGAELDFDPTALVRGNFTDDTYADLLALRPDNDAEWFALPATSGGTRSTLNSVNCTIAPVCGDDRFEISTVSYADAPDQLVGISCDLHLELCRVDAAGHRLLPVAIADSPTHAALFRVDAVDADGDGNDDLIVERTGTSVILWDDGGTFPGETELGVVADHVAVGNLDGDPEPELVVASGAMTLIDQIGARTIADSRLVMNDGGQLRLADLDGDGVLDLAIGDASGVRLYRNVPQDER